MEIVSVEGHGIFAWLIKKVTKSNKTHVALRYSGEESNWIVHASIRGVQPEWWYFFKDRYKNISRFRCDFDCADSAIDLVVKRIGHKEYDIPGVFGYGIYMLQNKLGLKRKTNPLGSANRHWCTDVIIAFFKACNELDPTLGLKEFKDELTTPKQIEEYIMGHPKFSYITE